VNVTAPAVAMAGQSMEAAMVGTFLVCLRALVTAVLGSAWIGPTGERSKVPIYPPGSPD
jgi:hypothetical protein